MGAYILPRSVNLDTGDFFLVSSHYITKDLHSALPISWCCGWWGYVGPWMRSWGRLVRSVSCGCRQRLPELTYTWSTLEGWLINSQVIFGEVGVQSGCNLSESVKVRCECVNKQCIDIVWSPVQFLVSWSCRGRLLTAPPALWSAWAAGWSKGRRSDDCEYWIERLAWIRQWWCWSCRLPSSSIDFTIIIYWVEIIEL